MRVLFAGLGAIGQRHLRNLRQLKGEQVEILAYRLMNTSKVLTDDLKIVEAVDLEEKYHISSFTDLDQALAQKPEIVFVCNPSSLHIPVAIKAAQAGCHLFIEKPLAHNYDLVDDLIDLVEKNNLIAVVGYQMRFHPCLQRLHSLLEEKKIGRILSARMEVGEFLPGWHTYEDYRNSYASRKDLGGGALLSQIHEMDTLYWLFGLPLNLYSRGGHLSSLEIDVEDVVETLMECEVEGHVLPISLHQDYVQRPGRRFCELIGDRGKILVDLAALRVDVFNGEGIQVENTNYTGFQRNQMFLEELSQFLSSTGEGLGSLVSLGDGAQSLRMALAAKESLTTGKIVELARK